MLFARKAANFSLSALLHHTARQTRSDGGIRTGADSIDRATIQFIGLRANASSRTGRRGGGCGGGGAVRVVILERRRPFYVHEEMKQTHGLEGQSLRAEGAAQARHGEMEYGAQEIILRCCPAAR